MSVNNFTIQTSRGDQVQSIVDAHYKRNNSRGRARRDDLFFLAMLDDVLAGCVRYCVESGTPMLRTMMVDAGYRRQGVGKMLLSAFSAYLDQEGIDGVYCLPYPHLEGFYGSAGFMRVHGKDIPTFLIERLLSYDPTGTKYICMKRP